MNEPKTREEADAHWARHFYDKADRLKAELQVASQRENVLSGIIEQRDARIADLEANVSDLETETERLRTALGKAAGQLGYLSTALSLSNKPLNAKEAWEWSEEASSALREGLSDEHR